MCVVPWSGSRLAPGSRTDTSVLECDQPFGISLVLDQRKVALREAARKQRDAVSQQDRNNPDVEFVNQIRFEEVAGKFTTAHQSNVFARALAEFRDKCSRGLVDERPSIAFTRRLRTGEDIHRHVRSWERSAAHFQTGFEGLASHDGRVDGGEKWSHRVISRHEQEVDRSVWACDISVEADAKAENYPAHVAEL